MQRKLFIIFGVCMMMLNMPISAQNAEPAVLHEDSYKGFTWQLLSDKTLKFMGVGEIPDTTDYPWEEIYYIMNNKGNPIYNGDITRVEICEGITSVPRNMISTTIYDFTFITEISFPSTLEKINSYAFASLKFTEINLPNSVTHIYEGAFRNCYEVTKLTIPESILFLGDECFNFQAAYPSMLDSIVMKSATPPAVEGNPFWSSAVSSTEFIIPEGSKDAYLADPYWMAFITKHAKAGVNVDWKYENDTLTIFGSGKMFDFRYTDEQPWYLYTDSIRYIVMDEEITNVGNRALASLDSVYFMTIPESVSVLGIRSLAYSGFVSLNIPNSVISMGEKACYKCDKLEDVVLGKNVESIGSRAFDGCTALKNVQCNALAVPQIASSTFNNLSNTVPVLVPNVSFDLYKADENWTNLNLQRGYRLTVSADAAMGSVSVADTSRVYYPAGSEFAIAAVANEGFHFSQWSDGVKEAERTVVLNSDSVITAQFAPNSTVDVVNPEVEDMVVVRDGQIIIVSDDVDVDGAYMIYSLNGAVIREGMLNNGSAVINGLPKSCYVVRVNSRSYKVAL